MRWEDQELNYKTCDAFPEIVFAFHSLLGRANQLRSCFVRVDPPTLDEMVADGRVDRRASGARTDRLCLYFRLMCRIDPGGDHYPSFGTFPYWSGSENVYCIVRISPKNDWLDMMVVVGEAPITPPPQADPSIPHGPSSDKVA